MECLTFDLDPLQSCADRCNYATKGEIVCYDLNNGHRNFPARQYKFKQNLKLAKSSKFVNTMIQQIRQTRQRQFRWFGSGDLLSYKMLNQIVLIAKKLPKIDFWLPTSRDDILMEYFEVKKKKIPDNLTIRLSCPDVCKDMPHFLKGLCKKWGIPYSLTTMNPKQATCQASLDGLSCQNCEDCFDSKKNVVYLVHNTKSRAHARKIIERRAEN
jgi:hypothetical protein